MTAPPGYRVGSARLTRVPYFDVPLPPETVQLSAAEVLAIPWAAPVWAQADGAVRIGQAVWVIESEGRVIVVDPCGAADAFIRTGPEAVGHQDAVLGAMAAAGFPPERVDLVVLSHLDGIGMTAVVDADGRWQPAFPNAEVLLTAAERSFVDGAAEVLGRSAFLELERAAPGRVRAVPTPAVLTGEVTVEGTGGHSPGHAVVRVASQGQEAILLGHLALSPLNLVAGDTERLHVDRSGAEAALAGLLADAAGRHALLVGPLWPEPGAVTVSGPPWVITPA